MSNKKIQTILGTMQFGKPEAPSSSLTKARVTDIDVTKKMLEIYYAHGHQILDTARMYCAGQTEEVLGDVGVSSVEVHTKAFPATAMGGEGLTPSNIRAQLLASLAALKRDSVDLFYLHWPDHVTPIKDSLRAVNELHREGKFKEFGISNYSAWQVAEIYYICENEGWIKPTVYQGMYNAITRDVERELFPCLRKFGIRFYAYNPLAGGFLSNIYKLQDEPSDGRFDTTTFWGQRYRERYWKKEAFGGLELVSETCKKHSISTTEASIRWMYSHSLLKDEFGDGVILGASSAEQLETNLKAVEASKDPLPQDIVDAFEEAWRIFRPVCPSYFR